MKAMKELMKLDDLPCCQVLFLAHETCEKALKAGKYAHFGLNSVSLKSHELNTHALALSTVSRELSELPMLVCSEDYYLDTRFPNRFDPQCAPVSKKTLMDKSEAQKISSNAEEVVKRIRKFVEEKKTSAL
jgi:sacsin